MATITRGSLPSNYSDFIESVSAGMHLPQPEPQYLFAQMAMAGRLSFAAMNAGAQTVQQYVTMNGGGAQLPPELDRLIRVADAFPGAVKTIDEFGKGRGDTIKFERDVYTAGTATEASRKLVAGQVISTTGQLIKSEEVPVTLFEYHGPHDGSSVKPYEVWDFDAKYRANKEAIASKVTRHMRRDYVRWLDTVVRGLFCAGSNITHADDVSNAAAFTATSGHGASLDMIMAAKKSLSDREWPMFPDGSYVCLVPTKFNRDMVSDPDYRALSAFQGNGRNLIMGHIATIQNVHIVECTTLPTYAAGSAAPDGQTVAGGATVLEAVMFGPGVPAFGTGLAPEARFADDTNYGTVAKVIWYALHAFQTLDSRGVQRILFQ